LMAKRVLVIGGSGFLGGEIVEQLQKRGHAVTALQRNPKGRNGVEEVSVDISQSDQFSSFVQNRSWSHVIDVGPKTSPKILQQVSAILKQAGTTHYTFVSSLAVYSNFSTSMDETSPTIEIQENCDEELSSGSFGKLKVGCEQAVCREFPSNHLIIRPGLIIGPGDSSGRFAYWVNRFLNTEETRQIVAAPESPEYPTQAIDVRDLANWIITMIENDEVGIYNAVESFTIGDLIEGCQTLSSPPKEIRWISGERLNSAQIKPFSQLPMWVPEAIKGLSSADHSKASAKGLRGRPLVDTIKDTADWLKKIGPDAHLELIRSFWAPVTSSPSVGLDTQVEADLLK